MADIKLFPRQKAASAILMAVLALSLSACAGQGPKKFARLPQDPSLGVQEMDSDPSASVSQNQMLAARAMPLADGDLALRAWLDTIDSARTTIDLKTFIFRPDHIGMLVSKHLTEAADRGVRVRILVDDLFHFFKQNDIGYLTRHPNIEVRIFNPLDRRLPTPFNLLLDFERVNPRMHNKALIADGRTAIIGGRNVASEYFRQNKTEYFSDLDLLVSGPAALPIAASFENYWNDEYSVPHGKISRNGNTGKARPPSTVAPADTSGEVSRLYDDLPVIAALPARKAPAFEVLGRLAYDPPTKLRASESERTYIAADSILGAVAGARESVLIVTPYFIPEGEVSRILTTLAAKGVDVRVLTNSLGSTNHPSTHAGYLRQRAHLLKAGVQIFEFRENVVHPFRDGAKRRMPQTTLHTKMVLVDGSEVIVGSLNFDPRSIELNAELAFHAESPELADWFQNRFTNVIERCAFQVRLDTDGKEIWQYRDGDQLVTRRAEPIGKLSHALVAALFSLLPMDSTL